MELTFEWDERKAHANERKHGVSFGEAKTVFGDPASAVTYDGEHSWAEDRFIIIGMSERQRVLMVVYVERTELTVRLISARRATRHEKQDYEEKADR